MGRMIGVTVAVLIWMAVLLAARGLVLGSDDPIDAVRCQGAELLSYWFGIRWAAAGSTVRAAATGLVEDIGSLLGSARAGA